MDTWSMIKNQGLSFTLIVFIVVWLGYSNHKDNLEKQDLRQEIAQCNGAKYNLLFELVTETKAVIERNNQYHETQIAKK